MKFALLHEAWWHMPVIQVPDRLRKKDREFLCQPRLHSKKLHQEITVLKWMLLRMVIMGMMVTRHPFFFNNGKLPTLQSSSPEPSSSTFYTCVLMSHDPSTYMAVIAK